MHGFGREPMHSISQLPIPHSKVMSLHASLPLHDRLTSVDAEAMMIALVHDADPSHVIIHGSFGRHIIVLSLQTSTLSQLKFVL